MSTVTFKYPFDKEATCRITGFKGTIIVRCEEINGSIQYGLQPKQRKEDSDYIADAKSIDEGYISGIDQVVDKVKFKFDCGQKVRNIVNDFEGTIVRRKQWLNGCIQYTVEGPISKTEIQGVMANINTAWEQELEAADKKPVKVTGKKRSGGPTTTFSSVQGI